jgi:hypothetical protein
LGNNSNEKEKLSIDPKKAEELVASFKFQFLSIVNDHAHYVPLNLPFGYDDDLSLPSLKYVLWSITALGGRERRSSNTLMESLAKSIH